MKRRILFLSCLVFLQACASQQRSSTVSEEVTDIPAPIIQNEPVSSETVYGPAEQPGPPAPAPESTPEVTTAPQAEHAGPKIPEPKLCLVLGPGLVRGFASAGVIEVLVKGGVPVNCILGVETGAVVGALFAMKPNINVLQWELFKITNENYFDRTLFKSGANAKKMHQFFKNLLGEKVFSDLPVKFYTSAAEQSNAMVNFFVDGDKVADALAASIAVGGIFDPWTAHNHKYESSVFGDPLPVAKARELGATVVIAVNVLEDLKLDAEGNARRYQEIFLPVKAQVNKEKKQADLVIEPVLASVPMHEFEKQSEALDAGRDKAEELLDSVKALWEKDQQRYRCAVNPENCGK